MDPNQAVRYTYRPLSSPREIRVVILEPSMEYNVPLRFSFHQACLEDVEGQYEAVSYVWGEPKLDFPLYNATDNSQVPVTQNLDRALRKLRYRLDPRWLWADAICIDQRNDQEKATQIPLMVNIFRGAKGVLSWLHHSDEAIERGMRFLERLSRRSIESIMDAEGQPNWWGFNLVDKLTDVTKLFDLPYFQRLWITQGIVFSLDITLICGNTELSWLRMFTALMFKQYWPLAKILRSTGYNNSAVRKMSEFWRQNCMAKDSASPHNGDGEHLIDLVSEFRTYGCTDPRDRIFALYAIAKNNNAGMVVDYTLGLETTYRNFAIACMNNGLTTRILTSALARQIAASSVMWPSWVPDWRVEPVLHEEYWSKLPQLHYTGTLFKNTVAVSVEYRYPYGLRHPYYNDLRPLNVETSSLVTMTSSVYTSLSSLIELYKKCGKESTRNPYLLWDHLFFVWAIAISRLSFDQLRNCLDHLWEPMIGWWDANKGDCENILSKPMATVAKGCCFFEAKLVGCDNSYFCYEPYNVMKDDVLVIGEGTAHENKHQSTHHAFILRPVKELSERRSNTDHGGCLGEVVYRLIGDTYVTYPKAEDLEGFLGMRSLNVRNKVFSLN